MTLELAPVSINKFETLVMAPELLNLIAGFGGLQCCGRLIRVSHLLRASMDSLYGLQGRVDSMCQSTWDTAYVERLGRAPTVSEGREWILVFDQALRQILDRPVIASWVLEPVARRASIEACRREWRRMAEEGRGSYLVSLWRGRPHDAEELATIFIRAAAANHGSVARALTSHVPNELVNRQFRAAIERGAGPLVRALTSEITQDQRESGANLAMEHGHPRIAQRIRAHSRFQTSSDSE